MLAQCRWMARSHVDMMFHLFCAKGHSLAPNDRLHRQLDNRQDRGNGRRSSRSNVA